MKFQLQLNTVVEIDDAQIERLADEVRIRLALEDASEEIPAVDIVQQAVINGLFKDWSSGLEFFGIENAWQLT